MRNLIKNLCQLLDSGEDIVVATIVSSSGSAPRTAGTKMIIRANGEISGTIGGGLVEARAQQTAPQVYANRHAQTYVFDMTGANADTMDMICGGEVEVLLEHIAANDSNRALFQAWQQALEDGRRVLLVTPLQKDSQTREGLRCLIEDSTIVMGPGQLDAETVERIWTEAKGKNFPLLIKLPQGDFYVEPSFVPATLFLFGAGHVCQPTAALAHMVGFNTVVLDDREEFANRKRFPTASTIHVVGSYEGCMNHLDIDASSYLVIISRGHRHDQTLLHQALHTGAGYIGMIGSRGKRDKIYRNLLDEGVPQGALDKVYAPIGMAIEAETPEEIAVSIVGELILARARNQVKNG
ncbi:MAG: XdhC family protein [Syntrophotaleaceae bacterium]